MLNNFHRNMKLFLVVEITEKCTEMFFFFFFFFHKKERPFCLMFLVTHQNVLLSIGRAKNSFFLFYDSTIASMSHFSINI